MLFSAQKPSSLIYSNYHFPSQYSEQEPGEEAGEEQRETWRRRKEARRRERERRKMDRESRRRQEQLYEKEYFNHSNYYGEK